MIPESFFTMSIQLDLYQQPLSEIKRKWIDKHGPLVLERFRGREWTAEDLEYKTRS